ncbi:MAG: hypothetical protein EDQ89_04615 [Acidobacteria bacterium]|nr:MAG: hypothetical protein EDQ89_04615 [Acidobacteriota bacterium]MCL4288321.1 amidohydrolase family protein [Thermoleophilia bacterium]GIK78251.1 MAG: hypothetical protein BroJett022_19410 [Actinomycetes bacterium]
MGSARQLGLDKRVGSLVPGKDADIVVVDRNPLETELLEIESTQVLRTMVAGETVYQQPQAP